MQQNSKEFDRKLDSVYLKWKKNPQPVGKKQLSEMIGCHYQVITRIEKRAFEAIKQSILRNWIYD